MVSVLPLMNTPCSFAFSPVIRAYSNCSPASCSFWLRGNAHAKKLRIREKRKVVVASMRDSDDDLKDDVKYFSKFAVGCVAVAGVIKYGSLVVPDATIPNKIVALSIIVAPVILALLILSWASLSSKQGLD